LSKVETKSKDKVLFSYNQIMDEQI